MGVVDNLNYFRFGSMDTRDNSIVVLSKTRHNAPARVVTKQSVPGRSGDLIIDEERFENVEISYTISTVPSSHFELKEIARRLKGFLSAKGGYLKLYDSYDQDYFRYAAFNNSLDIEEVLPELGECEIVFDCKPFQYAIVGQAPIILDSGSIELYNREAFDSKPYIKIYGSGTGSLYVNNQSFNFSDIDEYIELDSEIKDAYKGLTPQNSKMNGAEFPTFTPGINVVSFSGGITSIEIIPRWATL